MPCKSFKKELLISKIYKTFKVYRLLTLHNTNKITGNYTSLKIQEEKIALMCLAMHCQLNKFIGMRLYTVEKKIHVASYKQPFKSA